MCYKAYMRKWMRERMKRRKKPEQTTGTDSKKPVPLQPDYYDAQAGLSSGPVESERDNPLRETEPAHASHGSAGPEGPASETHDAQAVDAQPESPAAQGEPQRRKRRRGRGGRGRGRGERASGAARATTEPQATRSEVPEAPVVPDRTEPVAARPSKGVVVLAIGLPGSGKSSWFKRHQIQPLSSDLLRALLFDDADEQRFQDLVFSNLRSMLKARLIARRPMNYVDATNLTPQERSHWVKLARDYGYEAQAVFFDVPLEVCLDRNRRRQRVVDEAAMRRMSAKLRPPTFDEGFSKITVVRVKRKDGEAPASEAS